MARVRFEPLAPGPLVVEVARCDSPSSFLRGEQTIRRETVPLEVFGDQIVPGVRYELTLGAYLRGPDEIVIVYRPGSVKLDEMMVRARPTLLGQLAAAEKRWQEAEQVAASRAHTIRDLQGPARAHLAAERRAYAASWCDRWGWGE